MILDLLQMYLEWRAQDVTIAFSIANWVAIAAPIIGAVAGQLLSGGGGGTSHDLAVLSGSQAQEATARAHLLSQLQRLIGGTPSAMAGILEATDGQGFRLPRNLTQARDPGFTNLEEILGSIDFDTQFQIQNLSQLLGQTSNNGSAAGTLASLQAAQQREERSRTSQLVSDLVFSLLADNDDDSNEVVH